jgi:DNA-nicking Smr family endonuclease
MKKNQKSGDGPGHDDDPWEKVKKTVMPYARDTAPPEPPPPLNARVRNPAAVLPSPAVRQTGPGFDRATETKLKKGRLPIEGRIDLHGMTQEEAFRALQAFIGAAVLSGKRTVLVITVLKGNLPLWLERQGMREHILAVTAAQPKDGGGGAFYIRLRKPRQA